MGEDLGGEHDQRIHVDFRRGAQRGAQDGKKFQGALCRGYRCNPDARRRSDCRVGGLEWRATLQLVYCRNGREGSRQAVREVHGSNRGAASGTDSVAPTTASRWGRVELCSPGNRGCTEMWRCASLPPGRRRQWCCPRGVLRRPLWPRVIRPTSRGVVGYRQQAGRLLGAGRLAGAPRPRCLRSVSGLGGKSGTRLSKPSKSCNARKTRISSSESVLRPASIRSQRSLGDTRLLGQLGLGKIGVEPASLQASAQLVKDGGIGQIRAELHNSPYKPS